MTKELMFPRIHQVSYFTIREYNPNGSKCLEETQYASLDIVFYTLLPGQPNSWFLIDTHIR